jgi:alkylation response protein AidB-like acyl-CoA dehydrogenase
MDFNTTDEQTMLRDTVSRYLADTYTFDARMKTVHGGKGWNPAVWKAFAEELGILGAPFSEAHGGLGGGAIENMIVMEEIGRALVIEPYLPTVVIAGGALKATGGALADAVIPEIIAGNAIIAFAYAEPQGRYNLADLRTTAKKDGAGYVLNGHKSVVYSAPYATHLLVTVRSGGSQREGRRLAVPHPRRSEGRHPPRLPDRRRLGRIGSLFRKRRGRRRAHDRWRRCRPCR